MYKIFFLSTVLTFLVFSCGLPDLVPQLNKPSININTSFIIGINSFDTKPNGSNYSIYGIDIYYKIYKRIDSVAKFNNDYQSILINKNDPTSALNQASFRHIASQEKDNLTNNIPPVYSINTNDSWEITIDFSTGSKGYITIYDGQTINGNGKSFYRFSINKDNKYKLFSAGDLDTNNDIDLSIYRNDNNFSTSDTSFGIILFVYAQDIDWSYLPFFSEPIMLGPYIIN